MDPGLQAQKYAHKMLPRDTDMLCHIKGQRQELPIYKPSEAANSALNLLVFWF